MTNPICKRCAVAKKPKGEWLFPFDGSVAHWCWPYGKEKPIRMHLTLRKIRAACGHRFEMEVDSSG
jgi:hypothetical protein